MKSIISRCRHYDPADNRPYYPTTETRFFKFPPWLVYGQYSRTNKNPEHYYFAQYYLQDLNDIHSDSFIHNNKGRLQKQ